MTYLLFAAGFEGAAIMLAMMLSFVPAVVLSIGAWIVYALFVCRRAQ